MIQWKNENLQLKLQQTTCLPQRNAALAANNNPLSQFSSTFIQTTNRKNELDLDYRPNSAEPLCHQKTSESAIAEARLDQQIDRVLMNNPGNKVREQAISVDLSDIEQLRFEL